MEDVIAEEELKTKDLISGDITIGRSKNNLHGSIFSGDSRVYRKEQGGCVISVEGDLGRSKSSLQGMVFSRRSQRKTEAQMEGGGGHNSRNSIAHNPFAARCL